MGKELKIPQDKINEFVEKANAMHNMVNIAVGKVKKNKSVVTVDERDLNQFATCFELHGDTEEEKQADLNRQVQDMYDAFFNNDIEKKKVYLDRMFDLLDSIPTLLEQEITDFATFSKVVTIAELNQTFATKRVENPEYILDRYNTPEKKLNKRICMGLSNSLGTALQDFKDKKAPNLNLGAQLSSEMVELAGYQYIQNFNDCFKSALDNDKNEMLFDIPTRCADDVKQELDKYAQITFSQPNAQSDLGLTLGKFLGEGQENLFIVDDSYSFVFLDDKPISEIAREELLQKEENANNPYKLINSTIEAQGELVFRKALFKGDKVISYVVPQYNKQEDKLEYSIVRIKPNVEKLKNDLTALGKTDDANLLPTQDEVNKVYENASSLDNTLINKFSSYLDAKKYEYYDKVKPARYELNVKSEEIINEGIRKFDEIYTLAQKSFKNSEVNNSTQRQFDSRDLLNIACLFNVKGETIDEKQQDMDRQFKEMTDAFVSNDSTKKEKYLDLLYNSYSKSILGAKREVQTADEVKLLIASTQFSQAINTKEQENPEYFFNHFKDCEKHSIYCAQKNIHKFMDTKIKAMYDSHEHKHNLSVLFMSEEYLADFDLLKEFVFKQEKVINNSRSCVEVDIPLNYKDLSTEDLRNKVDNLTSMVNTESNDQVIYKEKYKSSQVVPKDYTFKKFFLNDECVESLAIKELRKTKEYKDKKVKIPFKELEKKANDLIGKALMKGDKAVSYVSTSVSGNRTINNVMKIKPNLKAIRDEEMSKHGWIRKTFFNWGPFKINCPPEQDKIDKVYNQDFNKTIIHKSNVLMNAYGQIKTEQQLEIDRKAQEVLDLSKEKNLNKSRELRGIETTEDLIKSIALNESKENNEISTSMKHEEKNMEVNINVPKVDD